MNLRPEIRAAAEWLQQQLDEHPFADVGVTCAQHAGRIQRIDYAITEKLKPAEHGGRHAPNKRS